MQGPPTADSSRSALELVRRLVTAPVEEGPDLAALLGELGLEAEPEQVRRLDRGLRQQRLEAIARVVRRVAHDFGNVLTGILGFSELALTQTLPAGSPLHAYLAEIHKAAQNGAAYLDQLRLFARRQGPANRSAGLAVVVAEEEKRLRPLPAGVRLSVDMPADLPAAAVELGPLRQALAAVLDNARDAVGESGTITVTARPVELTAGRAAELYGDARPGAHVEVCVADSGPGLSEEARKRLFREPFFTTRPRKRGFGLATAYGIVCAHRGGLELCDRPEGGTLARLVLPAVAVPAPPRGPSAALTGAPPRERVLVVDDDPMILQLVATTLERAGYRVHAVASAEEAFRSYAGEKADPFGLVLSDVLMPEVNGIELARRLLAHDAAVRVLFMSGQVPADFPRQEFGADRFELVPKPFRPDGLLRAVRAALADKVTR